MDYWDRGFAVEVQRTDKTKDHFDIRYRCPWCAENSNVRAVYGCSLPQDHAALLVVCEAVRCRRPSMITVRFGYPDGFAGGLSKPVAQQIYPNPQAHYAPEAVPGDIAEDFQEALNCQNAGFLYGAAVVGRRALQAALADKGATSRDLVEQINQLDDEELPKRLKIASQHVRLIGNDAAHVRDVTAADVESLIRFVDLVLEQMYVLPYEIAKQTRTIQPQHMPGAKGAAGAAKPKKGDGEPGT